jgi:hypothetical protein
VEPAVKAPVVRRVPLAVKAVLGRKEALVAKVHREPKVNKGSLGPARKARQGVKEQAGLKVRLGRVPKALPEDRVRQVDRVQLEDKDQLGREAKGRLVPRDLKVVRVAKVPRVLGRRVAQGVRVPPALRARRAARERKA